MPYYPSENDDKAYFCNQTTDIKIVSDYTKADFNSIYDYNIFEFYGYLHDAVVWNCSKSEQGREYLENAYHYGQTKPDRKALREVSSKQKTVSI